ncbi:MAG: PD40 domain-containing protein [Planctomycetes bacterium]|nr:PD40 domain-containing protein [Planctomycetota bacterium]MCW8135370.1 PD40 domain-containing protein [Planctomycetota bacterium]
MRTAFVALLVLFAVALNAQRQPQPKPVLDPAHGVPGARFPSLSPDKKTVVFALHGDIWSVPAAGGRATRLTMHEAYDSRPLVTPDGKQIVFISDREGSYDLWVMPIDGGPPRRLTHHFTSDVPNGFTADGKHVLFTSTRAMSWHRASQTEIWSVPLAGGTPKRMTYTGGHSVSTPDNGATLYYVAGASDSKVAEYQGTANDRLFVQRGDDPAEEILYYRGNTREPSISRDGKRLHFTREVNGSFELFFCDTTTQTCEQVTSLGEGGLSNVSFAPDDSMITFVWKFYLYTLDMTDKNAKPRLLKLEIREDSTGDRMVERRFTDGVSRIGLSSDGRRVVFSLGGDIWIMDANGGAATQLTDDGFTNENPKLSPDGRTISYYSNRSGNSDIWLMDSSGRNLRQFTTNTADDFFQCWSPDGQAIVFCSVRSGNKDVWLKRLDGGSAVQLTTDAANDDDPTFSPDGRYILFDSGRSNPNGADIWIMDADGKNQRRVYGTTNIEEVPVMSPDGRFILFNRVTRGSTFIRQEVVMTDLAGSGEVVIAQGNNGNFTPDGKDILFLDAQGRLVYTPTPAGIQTGRVVPFTATRRISERAEMLKAFDEAHKSFSERFYDAKFHGKDWEALGKKYRALVESCGSREEYLYYLNRMVGEVSASHTGASARTIRANREETGYLGMELDPEVMPGNRLRLKVLDVEKGGPADKAWIRKGDYVFRIDRKTLAATDNFYAHLDGKVGKEVSLFVADNPEGNNFREVTLTAESFAQRRQRHYQLHVMGSKQTAAQQSRGQVAYVHIPGMNQTALNNFTNELASPQVQAAKALIIDVRDNGGGNIHQQLIDVLSRKPYAYIQLRDGRRINQPTVYWDRPIVILINERSYSDAEVWPHAMKRLGMATVVGVQTPGAVIGTNDIRLSDGTNWRLPGSGFFNWDGTNQEHNGCTPDIEVQMTPADIRAGRDPQLAKGIEVALEKIRNGGKAPITSQPEQPQPKKPAKEGEFIDPPALPWE